jgi:two-component system nitrogen regulation response regulator GlnG
VVKGTFREDLYYRLAILPINVPPLRERDSDLALLGRHFRIRAAHEANRPVPQLDPSSIELLRSYPWPGNVRELRDVLTRAVLRCRGDVILPEHLGLAAGSEKSSGNGDGFASAVRDAWASGDPNLHQRLHDGLDRELIRHALERCGGNQTQVADILGLSRNTVRKLVQKFGLE